MLGRLADGITGAVEQAAAQVSGVFFEPTLRLGVTGLARAGKTVFITSLVANLMDRGRMPGLRGASRGTIRSAWLQPQPDDTVPRFAYEAHLADLTGPDPKWPDSTRAVSQLRLSFRVQGQGMLGAMSGPRVLHLDIVDYPGEWLLDLGLMDQDYATWSSEVLGRARGRAQGAEWMSQVDACDPLASYEETGAQALANGYTRYLQALRAEGYSDCTPGRFLMPGEMEGSPALTFAPLPEPGSGKRPGRGSLYREMQRRFEAYKAQIVRPFFRDHFAKIDRQVVLVDLLDAIHAGPRAVEDLGHGLDRTLAAFRPGRASWLTALLGGRRIDRLLLAATKADHLHHHQHGRMTAVLEALLRQARDRADFAGARTAAMSIAALRATVEETRMHQGHSFDMVRGRLLPPDGRVVALYPGEMPEDPTALLVPAQSGAERWLDGSYDIMRFAPAPGTLRPGEGPPHIRLDRAAEFLIGDRLV